jgi:hypothetical protein
MRLQTAASLAALLFISCADEIPSGESLVDSSRLVLPDQNNPDLQIITTDTSPLRDTLPVVDPCENPDISDHEEYCRCLPQCCSSQEWWCPPQPDNTIQSMQVIVEVCNDDGEQCEFGEDPECPPPQIIHQSECRVTFDCPPGSSRDFLQWFECQLADGSIGQQRVLCDKGRIVHGPCITCEPEVCDNIDNDCDERIDEDPIPCEDECGPGVGLCIGGEIVDCVNRDPSEEICNFIDDDCDGLVDEDQRNACDECGELPEDVCDGVDNDCDGTVDEELVQECETICGFGLETCIGGQWASCTAQQPIDEECDGLDNDCDGIPDEGINCLCTIDQVGVLFPCAEEPLLCGAGFKTCECMDIDCTILQMGDCMALCGHFPNAVNAEECEPTLGTPVEDEICNNFDEDCDELLDEELVQACYTGPRETLNVGICRPGRQTCQEGRWGAPGPAAVWTQDVCGNEVLPQREVCDGADNDCDGNVDYGEELRPTDILLIIDSSGSMGGEIRAVTTALSRFGRHFAAEDALHWGLILGPTRMDIPDLHPTELEVLNLISNISPFRDFFQRFIALDPVDFIGGSEMLMDALMLSLRNLAPLQVDLQNRDWLRGVISIPELEQFIVNWRQDTDRIIILFSDESEQSFMNPAFQDNEISAAVAAAPNTKLYTFVIPNYGWDEFATDSGGSSFNLSSDSLVTYNNLMSIIDEACLPRAEEDVQGANMSYDYPYILANFLLRKRYEEYMCY